MKCPRCESENPGGSVFCNVCGVRIAVLSEDSDIPYVIYPVFEYGRKAFGRHIATRKQFFTGLKIGLIPISITVALLMFVGGPEGICTSIILVTMTAILVCLFWYWGRIEAMRRR